MTRYRPQRRHAASKAELIARLHRGFRPRLVADQILDLGLVHASNLDLIASGGGTEKLLWDAVAGVLTWSKVAEMLVAAKVIEPDAVDLMAEQLQMTERLVARYGRTGRVAFDGTDYQLAKLGIEVMDQLARIVDRPTAVIAADWSEQRVNEMAAEGEKRLQARESQPERSPGWTATQGA